MVGWGGGGGGVEIHYRTLLKEELIILLSGQIVLDTYQENFHPSLLTASRRRDTIYMYCFCCFSSSTTTHSHFFTISS